MNSYEAIQLLAKAFGVELRYTDNWGRTFQTRPSVVRDILEKKGVWVDPLFLSTSPQIITFRSDAAPTTIPIYIDASSSFRDGLLKKGIISITDTDAKLRPLSYPINAPGISVDFDENTGLTRISAPVPGDLSPGDYNFNVSITVEGSVISNERRIIVAPAKAYAPEAIENGQRVAGIAVSLYGVRSEKNWGIGDFTDLLRIIDWAFDDLGAHFVGLNPLHALFNARPYNCSPYMPSSRIFLNYIYIDVVKAARSISQELSDKISHDHQIVAEASRLREA